MISLASIKKNVKAHQPNAIDLGDNKHAAVALMLRETEYGVEALFIERAKNRDDPWSGQMAFPGGMVERFDVDARQAAERETVEEVGIDLAVADYLGRMDDQQGRHRGHPRGIVVRGYVYLVDDQARVKANYEVQDIVWVSLQRFLDTRYYTRVRHPVEPNETFPGIRVSDKEHQVVWGLTHRFMASFFSMVGVEFGD
ncbi:MAG: CoA pyrophosphatase [Arenicellales bacterium]|nr:CoA pyrophosphatase [Arenicellales bacterium]